MLFDKAFDANPASTVVPFFKLPFYQFERLSKFFDNRLGDDMTMMSCFLGVVAVADGAAAWGIDSSTCDEAPGASES